MGRGFWANLCTPLRGRFGYSLSMTKLRIITLVLVSSFAFATNTQSAEANSAKPKPIKLLSRIGQWHHPVSTTNRMAQQFFDQGLTLVYGFNHDAAIRSFKRALELDPSLAMAHWGIGYALGPNINVDVDPEREKAAYEEAHKALALIGGAAEEEAAYILALTNRYSLDPKADLRQLQVNFKDAMGRVSKKLPDDLDAATLYAESMMTLQPWDLWTPEGKPKENAELIVAVLESVLRRDPEHPGANHYYIHAVEASRNPERALPSAERLESLVPVAGHLVHMPAHIYMRVGDFAGAARRNEVAAEADRDYIQSCGIKGVYPLLYYSHNLHFLAVANAMQGRFGAAKKASDKLVANVEPAVKEVPDLEAFLPTPLFIFATFQKWDEILKTPQPNPDLKQLMALWHFSRGVAYAATGKIPEAEQEHKHFSAVKSSVAPETKFGSLNKASDVLNVADLQLRSRIARAKSETKSAIELLEQAVVAEDALRYTEPPDWYLYSREALGGLLLNSGDLAKAESVFREDLERNPRKGRALFGLQKSLEAQGKKSAATLVRKACQNAWKNADMELTTSAAW
jgi:tetratricopeptide (TPR) repeat protein